MAVKYGKVKCLIPDCQEERRALQARVTELNVLAEKLAQERDHWQARAQDAETIGDYATDLQDRVRLLDDNKVLQLKVEEMRSELAAAEMAGDALEIDRNDLRGALHDYERMVEERDERIKQLEEQLAACNRTLSEALNSGDGSYKP